MSCEICGRNSCTRSFHSLDEQTSFDNIADGVKERMRVYLIKKIERLMSISDYGDDEQSYVKLSDVIDTINDY